VTAALRRQHRSKTLDPGHPKAAGIQSTGFVVHPDLCSGAPPAGAPARPWMRRAALPRLAVSAKEKRIVARLEYRAGRNTKIHYTFPIIFIKPRARRAQRSKP